MTGIVLAVDDDGTVRIAPGVIAELAPILRQGARLAQRDGLKLSQLQAAAVAAFAAAEKRYAESLPTVYRAYDDAGQLLYVGCTIHMRNRLAQHKIRSSWFHLAVRWTCELYETHEVALAAEASAIRAEHPLYNVLSHDGRRRLRAHPSAAQLGLKVSESERQQGDRLRVRDVARDAGCTPQAVRKAAKEGRLIGRRVDGEWQFDPADVQAWRVQRRTHDGDDDQAA